MKSVSWTLHIYYPMSDGETETDAQDAVIDALYNANPDSVMSWSADDFVVEEEEDEP